MELWYWSKPIGKTGASNVGQRDTFGNTGIGNPRGISPTTGMIFAPSFQNVHKIVHPMITWKMKIYKFTFYYVI